MAPLSHSLLPTKGPFGTRPVRLERTCSLRTQPLETAELAEQARNMRSSDTGVTGRSSEAADCSARVSSPETQHAEQSIGEQAIISDRLLRSTLTDSVTGWLDNIGSAGMWLADNGSFSPSLLPIRVDKRPSTSTQQAPRPPGKDPKQREDFYANIGEAIRTLKAEIPRLFQEDLTFALLQRLGGMKHGSYTADDIYREDIIFRDPRNFFQGKKDYKTIFWSLRFHGQLFFRLLYVDVLRIWESPENVKDAGTILKMRWTVHGVPRVPWDAEGIFDGISTFKVDSNGKIFEHAVNNIVLRDPPRMKNPILAGLSLARLAGQQQQQPCPGAWFNPKAISKQGVENSHTQGKLACEQEGETDHFTDVFGAADMG